ncbi:MAG TPA: hypothetical protein VG755_37015 [Nannocystaceae bacterium]|nr:hypothetical protein [Nannocystaceae bacterium]
MSDRERKDRLIQTRVPESLESALKEEATRRRLPVSQLVRNILEDTLTIVGDVVDGVDAIVQDSIKLGRNVGQTVARARAASEPATPSAPEPADDLSDVYAWNPVVLHRDATCARCKTALVAGTSAFVGMRDDASRGRAFLCSTCIAELGRAANG